jgi:hypothetical protein
MKIDDLNGVAIKRGESWENLVLWAKAGNKLEAAVVLVEALLYEAGMMKDADEVLENHGRLAGVVGMMTGLEVARDRLKDLVEIVNNGGEG